MGDDWAEDHHDVEVLDETGRTLARRRLPEGLAGITRLHALIGEHLPEPSGPGEPATDVVVGIETERGPWVAALVAAGYRVYAINPLSSARYRERHSTSGRSRMPGTLTSWPRSSGWTGPNHRQVAGDSALAEAVKLAARTHQSLIWDRTRQILRLRSALRESFPAALKAFDELDAPDTLQLLRLAPDPDAAARLTKRQVMAALAMAHRRSPEVVADRILAVLRAGELRQAAPVQTAFAAIAAAQVAIIGTLNEQIDALGEVVAEHSGRHPDAEFYTSLPGLGVILAARVLGEFGDDPTRYVDAKARKAYAGTAPITRASGTKKIVLARYARNKRLADALQQWAFCSMRGSAGAKAYYKSLRARNIGHQAALRQLANRWVGILHGCLKTGQFYDETLAWNHQSQAAA